MIQHLHSLHKRELEESEKILQCSQRDPSNKVDKMKDVNDHLAFAICTSSVPFRFLRNRHFQEFCASLNPDYTPLTPESLHKKFDEKCNEYIEHAKKSIKYVEKVWISVDGWDAKYLDKSLYAVFVYFVEKYERKSMFLGIEALEGAANAANVGKLVMEMLHKYNIDSSKVMGGVTDGGSNIVSFLEKNSMYHTHCSAHVLSLIIKKTTEIPHINRILVKVNRFAAFLSRSKMERGKFRERSTTLRIHGRIPLPFSETRWGGSLLLAKSFLSHYQSLSVSPALQDYLMSSDDLATLKKYVDIIPFFYGCVEQSRMR